ncbi:hypothetical protein F5876DRAFT_80267 [Lentinula aff. lateritia]|uniref:Uncharacterized protein n=1 Tax=Lentinula aff. lateritia TaxID=2804960 RepID=A0ACC1TQ27_9AGAR|nr:hypothetical protein F5876DRAFT_80267 [Lentinula aff. lateritia]
MAFVTLFFLPSFPFSASFFTSREKAIAQARVNRDHRPQSHGGMTGWQGFEGGYHRPQCVDLINDLGFTAINAQGLTVAPYILGWGMVVLQAWHSDKTRERGWHIIVSCVLSFVGYIILATSARKNVGASYFALFLVVGGLYSLFPLVMSWAANTLSPTSKRGVGTAFIVSIPNTVSIASPQIYFDPEDYYVKGHAISTGYIPSNRFTSNAKAPLRSCLFLSMLMAFALRTRLSWLNKRNAQRFSGMSEDEKALLPAMNEMDDQDPRYVFMT